MKYKVGDRIRVRKDLKVFHFYGGIGFVAGMHIYRGEICTVSKIVDGRTYRFKEDKGAWAWSDEMLEPFRDEKIVITTDGVTTTAKKYDGKKIVKEAKAVCSKDDTFNFDVGAKLAMERLMKEDKPNLYNGKVVCVDIGNAVQVYTKGKIYQFRDGVAYNDAGCRFHCCVNHPITSFDELRGKSFATWLEVVE